MFIPLGHMTIMGILIAHQASILPLCIMIMVLEFIDIVHTIVTLCILEILGAGNSLIKHKVLDLSPTEIRFRRA